MPETTASEPPLKTGEIPRNITQVHLPTITTEGFPVKLCMHTDNIGILLRTLARLPESKDLKIKGRALTPEQQKELEGNDAYRFYLSSRLFRTGLLVPVTTGLTREEVARLAQTPFTPNTLENQLGFRTEYYEAEDLKNSFLEGKSPNYFIPHFGGVNEFDIGSDTLTPAELEKAKEALEAAFRDNALLIPLAPPLNTSSSYTLLSFISLNKINKENITKYEKFLDSNKNVSKEIFYKKITEYTTNKSKPNDSRRRSW
jgi:hypothetical protein